MSILKTLKLSDQTRAKSVAAPEVRRRAKLLTNIERQIKSAEAALKGEYYAFTDFRYVTDPETGERTRKGVSVKVKQWWWKDIAGNYYLCIKYGSKRLEFAKDKFAIDVGEQKNLILIFEKIAEAVKVGELDKQIAALADKSFGKSIIPKKVAK